MSDIQPGAEAPAFTLPRDGGGEVSLADFRGKPVAVYFYPKDDTPGCTREAIAFSGLAEEFRAAGATVLGISRDPVSAHDKFREKHGLAIALLSDEGGEVCEAYGTWVEKSMYGKTYMGVDRATFLVDAEGRVARVWRKVKVPGHAEEVLEAAKAL